jgi:hypothetical protein
VKTRLGQIIDPVSDIEEPPKTCLTICAAFEMVEVLGSGEFVPIPPDD